MNNHLKSILKVCGVVGLICLVTVLSCLPFVNFDNNKAELRADTIDNYVTFDSANFYVTSSLYASSVTSPQNTGYTLYNGSVNFFFANGYGSSIGIDFQPLSNDFGSNIFVCSIDNDIHNNVVYDEYTYGYLTGVSGYHFIFHYYIDSGFNNNVVQYTVKTVKWGGFNNDIAQTFFSFIDSNGKRIDIAFFGNFNASDSYSNFNNLRRNNIIWYGSRTYYTNVSLSDNQNYIQGYNDGLQIGQSTGYENGYRLGSEDGFVNGYRQGYDNGLNEQDVYTFGNLLTAVIDAPVGVFISMLDFNIMGFNLLNLVVGLLTLAVICLVVKLILGGK